MTDEILSVNAHSPQTRDCLLRSHEEIHHSGKTLDAIALGVNSPHMWSAGADVHCYLKLTKCHNEELEVKYTLTQGSSYNHMCTRCTEVTSRTGC